MINRRFRSIWGKARKRYVNARATAITKMAMLCLTPWKHRNKGGTYSLGSLFGLCRDIVWGIVFIIVEMPR